MSSPPLAEAPARASADATHVPLGRGEWAWWGEIAVRSAGFPAEGVRRLAAPDLARRADELVAQLPIRDKRDPRWKAFGAEFDAAAAELEREMQAVVAQPRFQAALAWQHHHVLKRAVQPLLKRTPGVDGRNSKHRQREELVAGYWQRYCIKNDTIGFFGPVAWARTTPGPTALRHGEPLIEHHEVFFEIWALDQVAAALGNEEGMAEWIAPRRAPFVRLDGDELQVPGRPPVRLDPVDAEALRRCDARTPAIELARAVVEAGRAGDVAEVLDALERLRKKRWVTWALDVPADPRAERVLRRKLEAVGAPQLREAACAKLDELEALRARLSEGWQDPERLVAALDELDAAFTALAQRAPERNRGKTYGGRTLAYADARRDLHLDVGPEILAALEPFELILTSVRWFTHAIERAIGEQILAAHERFAERQQGPVSLAGLWFECMPIIHGGGQRTLEPITRELHERWAAILAIPEGVARHAYRAEDLRARVEEAFAAPHAGWSGARHCSPDLMIVAPDVEAIRRGAFEVVLAETHLALVSYRHNCFVTQHPDRDRLVRCLDAEHPEPRLLPVLPKESSPRLTIRTHPALGRDHDHFVALYHDTVDPELRDVHLGGGLVVERSGDRLVTELPDGSRYDVMECFSEMLMNLAIDAFSLLERREHTPRLTIDRLIVSRETWRFDAADLAFAAELDEPRRFVEARAWMRDRGLPEQVFVTSPLEAKPFFVDFAGPVSVNVLAKAARRLQSEDGGGTLKLTEMLPDLEQLWLEDADGTRYTSELRLVAYDQRPTPDEAPDGR